MQHNPAHPPTPAAGEADGARLVPIGAALAGALVLATAGAAGLVAVALAVLGAPELQPSRTVTLKQLLDVIKLAFASIAGIGGVIALVVAYRRQRVTEATARLEHAKEGRERTRLFNERFAAACGQLGDESAAVRLAGVHALAGLADDWPSGRQTCIDVLCAYLRMPYEDDPPPDATVERLIRLRSMREVRRTIWSVIGSHLRAGASPSWAGHDFDFTGAVIDCHVPFFGIEIPSGVMTFNEARIIRGNVWLHNAEFSGGEVIFANIELLGGELAFQRATFRRGVVWFVGANFSGGEVSFGWTHFCGAEVWFPKARFAGSRTWFDHIRFSAGKAYFGDAQFLSGDITFEDARFEGGEVDLRAVTGVDPAALALPPSAPGLLLPPSSQ
ncbi:pentapeptide repeat-containing protein [Actinomadura rubrisoli]|uniref:Pentapeptide repeat-containing protein n=1 Tax=Actinomadura rubrisoli TaxID=2530368 RepID=A0A4R5BCY3_9ACTN|nr:pentapeptide repeat-containing protein [Actinomadura rubrisoli]TDD82630.1 pentapeptide repeat-containing protein [Actinomadura rubrisoli]